jgi:NhaA family Na+:H+ antiporter
VQRRRDDLADFLHSETAGGVVLAAATLVALVWANVAADGYHTVWGHELSVGIGSVRVDEPLEAWVNDALMALFFFVVGLEIKRELVVGELRDRRAAALPVIAAAGGVVVPAALYLAFAGSDHSHGWAVPVATDIAFVVGIVALLGPRVPPALKLFLLTLAIADDIVGIAVIAVAYSDSIDGGYLAGAGAAALAVVVLRRAGVRWIAAYVAVGVVLWYLTYRSGVHATIAGVALGLLTPATPVGGRPVLRDLEHRLHPISALVIVPVFAVANAGVELGDGRLGDALSSRVAWAVVVGLVIGKPVGIFVASWLGVRSGLGRLPTGVTWPSLAAAGALAGIGFTVALFIARLAFDAPAVVDEAKVGVLLASLTAALVGALALRLTTGRRSGTAQGRSGSPPA